MLLKFISLFLLIPSLTFAADVDDCSTVENLAKDLGPVHNQYDLSWCYAFTTADLLSQKLQKMKVLKPGERIHPLEVAAELHLVQGRNPSHSTDITSSPVSNMEALIRVSKAGGKLCKESDLGPDTGPDAPIFKQSLKNALGHLSKTLEKDFKKPTCEAPKKLPNMMALSKEMTAVSRNTWIKEITKKCSVRLPSTEGDLTYPEAQKEKDGEDPLPPSPESAEKIRAALNRALDNKSMAGIRYKTDFMTAEKSRESGFHWSSVVARKKGDDGKCMYQIRNSWGKDCSIYKNPSDCEDGYIWQSAEDLINNMTSVVYIK